MPVVTPDMDKNYDCIVPLASNEARLVVHLCLVLSSCHLKIQDQCLAFCGRISKLWCVDVDIKALYVKQRARIVTGRQEWSLSGNQLKPLPLFQRTTLQGTPAYTYLLIAIKPGQPS